MALRLPTPERGGGLGVSGPPLAETDVPANLLNKNQNRLRKTPIVEALVDKDEDGHGDNGASEKSHANLMNDHLELFRAVGDPLISSGVRRMKTTGSRSIMV